MISLRRTSFLFLSLVALSAFNSIAQAQACGSGGGATVCLTATGSSSNIQLTWTVTGTITAIEVYRDIDSNPTGRVRQASLAATARSYTDSTAVTGTQYWYWIKFRANGTFFNSGAATATRGGGSCNPDAHHPGDQRQPDRQRHHQLRDPGQLRSAALFRRKLVMERLRNFRDFTHAEREPDCILFGDGRVHQ